MLFRTAGVCLICTIVSLVWWFTICHVQLGDSRDLHTGFNLCLVAMVGVRHGAHVPQTPLNKIPPSLRPVFQPGFHLCLVAKA